MLAPVERRRAVVREQLAGELLVHRVRELARLADVRRRGLAPEDVRVRRVRKCARDRLVDSVLDAVEAFRRSLAGDERAVVLVHVARQQRGRKRVRPREEQRRHVEHVGREARRVERADELRRRHEHLAAEVAALLLRRELVLVVHAGGAGLDHRPHELVRVQRAAEAGLRVGENRREPVRAVPSLGPVDLIGPEQCAVQALDQRRCAVRRVEALIRIRGAGEVRVRRHLPAGEVDRLQPGPHHLHRLPAAQRAERTDGLVLVQELPEALRPEPRERVLGDDRAAQADDVRRAVRPLDAVPARVLPPLGLELQGLLLDPNLGLHGDSFRRMTDSRILNVLPDAAQTQFSGFWDPGTPSALSSRDRARGAHRSRPARPARGARRPRRPPRTARACA